MSLALAIGANTNNEVCTLLLNPDSLGNKKDTLRQEDIIKQLDSKEPEDKIAALKAIILLLLSGENGSKLLMPVIKGCLRCDHHEVKKLLLMYWEVVDKYVPGTTKLLQEFILVCNNIRNDLTHPNEYIRGGTLRFLCKVHDVEILEPLIPAILANLEHRHSYVRKNAVLTIFTIFQAHPELIPDAPEQIFKFLLQESNVAAKRNAFLMLFNCDEGKAVEYLATVIDSLASLGDAFQLVVLELIRKVCRTNPLAKSQYIKAIFTLVNSPSHAVSYEAANTLLALSSAPTAVRAAIAAYITLMGAESDNNVKLIILNKLCSLKDKHEKLLQESLMDLLRSLQTPNVDIRRKTLELTMDVLPARLVEEVLQLLKKEIVRVENLIATTKDSSDKAYRKLLVDSIYQCAIKFPEVAPSVVQVLMSTLLSTATVEVIVFLREIVEGYPHLRNDILQQLCANLSDIKGSAIYRVALWILGEYSSEPEQLDQAISAINAAVGPLPLVAAVVAEPEVVKDDSSKPALRSKTVVLADGTYAQQVTIEPTANSDLPAKDKAKDTSLRSLLLSGDFYLSSVLGTCYTKLMLRFAQLLGVGTPETNQQLAKGAQVLLALLAAGEHPSMTTKIDRDSKERLLVCLHTLMHPAPFMDIFLNQCRRSFAMMLDEKKSTKPASKKDSKSQQLVRQADDLITFRQLKPSSQFGDEDDELSDIRAAAGVTGANDDLVTKLNTVVQLTGLADPVYAEAFVKVHEYDIVLDITVINQTDATLQNLMVELSANGDLRVLERPQTYTLAPFDFKRITAHVKVSSTESGTIFGHIVYDTTTSSERNVVVMSSIHMDIMDYISPASTSDTQFRSMWAEFEWENKVAVNTDITDLNHYLQHISKITNMRILSPPNALSGTCNFLAANLYATSIFGEEALLNLSIEKTINDTLAGFIRIRSKTQGVALSLGDKVQAKQRQVAAAVSSSSASTMKSLRSESA